MEPSAQERSDGDIMVAQPTFTIAGHEESVYCIVCLAGDRIATGSDDRTLRIWNLASGTQEGTSIAHQELFGCAVATKDGLIISSRTWDKHPMVWNADTQEPIDQSWPIDSEDHGPIWSMALSPNEELLACCHWRRIIFWEMAGTLQVRGHIQLGSDEKFDAKSARFSSDGKKLAVLSRNGPGGLVIVDVEVGQCIFGPLKEPVKGFEINAIIWSPDGDRLFCGCRDGLIRSWDHSTGETVGEPWTGHRRIVNCLCLSPDGKWLASGSADETVRFWNAESGEPLGEPLHHGTSVRAVAFSHSGEFIVCSGGAPGRILVWRVPWWDDEALRHPLLDVSAVISPDGLSNILHEFDLGFLDRSELHPRLPPRGRPRENLPKDPPRVHRSVRSWNWWWKMIPRLVHGRPHSILMGYAEPRTFAAPRSSADSSSGSESPHQSVPTSPTHDPDVTVVVEDYSEESSEGDTADAVPSDDLEVSRVGCCGLFARRRTRATPQQKVGPVEHSAPTATGVSVPTDPSSHPSPAPQDILELSAVIR